MFKNKKKGFSLVELIVVIAILAVFAAILIPSLLQYTENSRAQKDESAMDEVVNAVQLALADQDCYDEMLQYSCTNNYITYTDSSGVYGQVIADGEFWAPDGSGRATTITFNPEVGPNGDTVYNLDKALVNDMTYGNGSVAQSRVMEGAIIDNNQCYFKNASINNEATGYTYNRVRQTIGDNLITTSQTYRNSSFTIFIQFTQKDNVTVADVNGSFNGTNLYEGAVASLGSGTFTYNESKEAVETINGGQQESDYTNTDLTGSGSFTSDYKLKDINADEIDENLTLTLATTMQFDFTAQLYNEDITLCESYDELYIVATDSDGAAQKKFLEYYVDKRGREYFISLWTMPITKAVDTYTIQLFGVKDGVVYAGQKIDNWNIVYNLKRSYQNATDYNKKMCIASSIAYIADCQKYFNYKTNQLATSNLTQEMKDVINSLTMPDITLPTYNEDGYDVKLTNKTFILDGTSSLCFQFHGQKEWLGCYAKVQYRGTEQNIDLQLATSNGTVYEDYAQLRISDLDSNDGTDPITFTLYDKDGNQISTTYSISALQVAKEKNMVNLANYIIYSDKYFG